MSKLRRIHLIVGVALILFSFGLIIPIAPLFNLYFDNSGITLGMQIFFLLVFVFVGGYELVSMQKFIITSKRIFRPEKKKAKATATPKK